MSQTATTHVDPYLSEGTSPPQPFVPGYAGLRCRACGTPHETGPLFVCTRCFGPLEPTYDLPELASRVSRAGFDSRPADLWRFAELLPLDRIPTAGLTVPISPLTDAPRLAARLGLERLWVKDDSRNPTLSFKDRVVGVAAARASEFGFSTLACASTGNLSASVAASAAALGMRAVVFVPADLEPAKIAQAAALGATVVRVDGPYDGVNRLCLELTGELDGWAVVNVNLRPYYAEGSKTLAYEIAQQLGWRAPGVIVAPLASGSLYTKLGKGFGELATLGLIEASSPRFIGGQALGCGPIAAAFAEGTDVVRPVERPETIVRSLAIGNPADGGFALKLARRSEGGIFGVPDALTIDSMRLLAETEGILTETAGGVTLAALRTAIEQGSVGRDDEVVLVITGNGLKTLDAIGGDVSLPEPIAPTFDAFEAWWGVREERAAA
ncbi:MAG: threonine synthase [Chloroflexota bacterium]|nr:threonine synthase [Chloroflexota bacterium]